MTSIVNMSNDFIIKILTLGDSCVGKTSIILRYTKTPFPKTPFPRSELISEVGLYH